MRLVARGRKVYVENGETRLLRSMTVGEANPFMLVVGPFGPTAKFLGFSEHTYVLYFLIDSNDKQAMINIIQGGLFPVFQNRRGVGAPSTLDSFWRNKSTKTATQMLAGALQFVSEKDALYITHMSVRSKWRRNRLNWLMAKTASDREPSKQVIFHAPTDMGTKFMKKF